MQRASRVHCVLPNYPSTTSLSSRLAWYTKTPLYPSRSGSSTSSTKRSATYPHRARLRLGLRLRVRVHVMLSQAPSGGRTVVSEPLGDTYVHGAAPEG